MVKLHEYGPLIAVPEAFCAPDTVAVYVTPAASALDGVNVATVFPALNPTVPATVFPPESTTANDTVLGVTACENVAAGAADTALPVDPPAGTTLVTAGAPAGVTPKFLGAIGTMAGPMGPFAGIAAGPDGTLYVSGDAEGSVLAIRAP